MTDTKTAQQYIIEAEAKYIIPKIVRDKFVDLVKLIYETESMNDEEREYWMQIMPIMTEEQLVNFRKILVDEKEQLAKLDEEYENEMSKINQGDSLPKYDEEKIKEKMQKIKREETVREEEEKSKEAALLDQLENL